MKLHLRPILVVISGIWTLISMPLEKVYLLPTENIVTQLQTSGLVQQNQPIKLHLGCGENYFTGYINIDYPPTEHTVQTTSVADAYADITQLNCLPNSIDEIRSHHMFELFDRQTALALLCAWHTWLKPGGKIVIETPDFKACIHVFMNKNLSYKEKQVIVRHIFGSHEAHWAYHYDGWYQEKFEHVFSIIGFSDVKCELINAYYLIPSILVTGKKHTFKHIKELIEASKTILHESMVAPSESFMWATWCQGLCQQLKKLHVFEY